MTMIPQGGDEVVGFPPRGPHPIHLEATNPLVMWAYTNLSDPRWKFTRKYLTLRQDPINEDAQKLGLFSPDTWAAYFLNLGPITRVLPGQIAEQAEYWALFRDVKLAALTDEDLDRVLVPLARAIGGDQ